MSKVIVHIDLNAFFIRCEEIRDPSLINKPVAIGSTGRCGIISTCSYKAREYGVHSGQPGFKALECCPNLIFLDCDFKFYHVKSHEFFNFIKRYTKLVEPASCDECYADFTEAVKGVKDVPAFFKKLQSDLYKETKLCCSIGVSTTKFLAKMASDYKKPMGLTIIHNKDIANYLYPLDVGATFGIGKKSAPRLKAMGINTIGDLANLIFNKPVEGKETLGNMFDYYRDALSGKTDDTIYTDYGDQKSIGCSTTLAYNTSNLEEINKAFEYVCKTVSRRAKREGLMGKTIQIVAKEDNFSSHNKSITLSQPTNDYNILLKHSKSLYKKYFSDLTVRLIGTTIQNVVSKKDMAIQMSFDNYEQCEQEDCTKLLINALNRKMKKSVLMRASEAKKDGNK